MEDILVPLFFFFFILAMTKMIIGYKREKREVEMPQPVDNSLRLSELRTMIQEAVREGNADLEARIEALEQEREAKAHEPARLPLGRPRGEMETGMSDQKEAAMAAQRSRD
ncbi:MAG: hypothetical protein ACR2GR_07985 [Rhodothermales bacterium]